MAKDNSMTLPPEAPKVRFPPPLVYLGFIGLAIILARFVAMPSLGLGVARPWLGGAALVTGLAIVIGPIRLFSRKGENPVPWTPTATIIDTGLYAYTRNPMYLGMAIAYIGIAILIDSLIALFLLPLVIAIIQTQVIAREEAYLNATFGTPYRDYCSRVRRWI